MQTGRAARYDWARLTESVSLPWEEPGSSRQRGSSPELAFLPQTGDPSVCPLVSLFLEAFPSLCLRPGLWAEMCPLCMFRDAPASSAFSAEGVCGFQQSRAWVRFATTKA